MRTPRWLRAASKVTGLAPAGARSDGDGDRLARIAQTERELHARLAFVELQLGRLRRNDPAWQRHVTVIDTDLSPLDGPGPGLRRLLRAPLPLRLGVAAALAVAALALLYWA